MSGSIAVMIGACSSHAPSRVEPTAEAAPVEWPELARRYERGDGMPRDYERAAEIYAMVCDHGRGEPAACQKLVAAIARARGRTLDRGAAMELLKTGCARGHWRSCLLPITALDHEAAERACERDDLEACVALYENAGWSQSGSVEDTNHERLDRACRGGVMDACVYLVGAHGELVVEDYGVRDEQRHALDVLADECRRGDADACEATGRPIAPTTLCAAQDYEACAALGLAGDARALQRACDHDVPAACGALAVQARDADPPDPRAAEQIQRACRMGAADVCRFDRPLEIASGCVLYTPTRVEPSLRRTLPALRGTRVDGTPWHAPAGRAFVLLDGRGHWARYPAIAKALGLPVYVLTGTSADSMALAPADAAFAIVLDPALQEEPIVTLPAATPPAKPTWTMLDLGARKLGDGWTKVVDDRGQVRATMGREFDIVPGTFARCVRTILAEP